MKNIELTITKVGLTIPLSELKKNKWIVGDTILLEQSEDAERTPVSVTKSEYPNGFLLINKKF